MVQQQKKYDNGGVKQDYDIYACLGVERVRRLRLDRRLSVMWDIHTNCGKSNARAG